MKSTYGAIGRGRAARPSSCAAFAAAADHAPHHVVVHAELRGDRADLPVLGVVQARDLRLDLPRDGHGRPPCSRGAVGHHGSCPRPGDVPMRDTRCRPRSAACRSRSRIRPRGPVRRKSPRTPHTAQRAGERRRRATAPRAASASPGDAPGSRPAAAPCRTSRPYRSIIKTRVALVVSSSRTVARMGMGHLGRGPLACAPHLALATLGGWNPYTSSTAACLM